MFSCFCHLALYTCSIIVYSTLLSMIASTREGNDLYAYVPNGNDDDVIINYIIDMDLGEDIIVIPKHVQ